MATAFVSECRQCLISARSVQLGQPRTQEFHLVGTNIADRDSKHGVTVRGFAPTLARVASSRRAGTRLKVGACAIRSWAPT